jgi:NAD(P)-dependent dehydrogenase (short-subunit alcohol dehydrogenase family)
MGTEQKVAVIKGASQGIGAVLVKAYRDRNYRVVAIVRSVKPTNDPDILVVPGDIWLSVCDAGRQTLTNSTPAEVRRVPINSASLSAAYFAPNKTIRELHELVESGSAFDPLKDFSEMAREELRAFTSQ